MTRETKKLFKVKRKITPLTVLVPLLLVVLLVCAGDLRQLAPLCWTR